MTALRQVSSCAGCATPIIGDCPRCAACQARSSRKESAGQILAFWVVFVEILAAVVCGILLGVRECS
jgi:hypothetical protein